MSQHTRKRIAIVGGGFDPPHIRHMTMVSRANFQFEHDLTYWVPSSVKARSLPGHLRLQMTALAIKRNRRFKLCSHQVDNPGAHNIETIRHLQQLHPGAEFDFIMGEDNVANLQKYERREEFMSLCRLLICPRQSTQAPDVLKARWQAMLPGANLEVVDCPSDELSSTIIRNWVSQGCSLRYVVMPAVERFIKKHKLYRHLQSQYQAFPGELCTWSEQGSEGESWVLQEPHPKFAFDGFHLLRSGDHLTVYNEDGSIIWQGVINLEYKTGWHEYPRNPPHGQQAVFGRWVHGNQRGFKNIEDWAEMFLGGACKDSRYQKTLRGILIPQLIPGREE
jgi:nicotinate-nucleotide adenylyltransferase